MAEHRELSPQRKSEGLGKRLKDTPRWVWIALLIAGATLVITYLMYQRNQQQANQANAGTDQTGANGGAVPGSTTSGGGTSGVDLSGIQAALTSENSLLQQLLSYFQQQGTLPPAPIVPTSAGGANAPTAGQGGSGGGGGTGTGVGTGVSGTGRGVGGTAGGGILGNIQHFFTGVGGAPAPYGPLPTAANVTGPTGTPLGPLPFSVGNLPTNYAPGQDGTSGTPVPPTQPVPQGGTVAGGALPPPVQPGRQGGGSLPPPTRGRLRGGSSGTGAPGGPGGPLPPGGFTGYRQR